MKRSTPVPPELDTGAYCREVERYLCQKNEGHLIRIVGPSFEIVSRWATEGVPLKVAFGGIDRFCERYDRKPGRKRPVRVDSCESDVLDVFDEWRRATGVTAAAAETTERRGPSLPEHLERVLIRLTNARALGTLTDQADELIDRVSRELDLTRRSPGGLRGEPRQTLMARLVAADADLSAIASASLDEASLSALTRQADEDLSGFRAQMAADAFAAACARAIDRLVRERLQLPTITFS